MGKIANGNKEKKTWIVPTALLIKVVELIDWVEYDLAKAKGSPIMFLGPTGAGKSLFVHIYEKLFLKKKGSGSPVVRLNCSAFNPALILAELFGHVKGAFTGAIKHRNGLISQADKGLLILEEIGDIPGEGQAQLLTFIEDGYYYRVGDNERRRADVHIIATTNKPPGDFRQDFWYRFFSFHVPGLYERRYDILYYFLLMFKDIVLQLLPHEVLALLAYNWPGNLRELERVGNLILSKKDKNTKERGVEKIWEKDKGLIDKFLQESIVKEHAKVLFDNINNIPLVAELLQEKSLNTEALNRKLLGFGLNFISSEKTKPVFSDEKKLDYTKMKSLERMFSDDHIEIKTCFDNKAMDQTFEGLSYFLLGEPDPWSAKYMNKNLLDIEVIKERVDFRFTPIGAMIFKNNPDFFQEKIISKEASISDKLFDDIKYCVTSMTHEELSKFYAAALLEANAGNKSKAAKAAGLNRNTFSSLLKSKPQSAKP